MTDPSDTPELPPLSRDPEVLQRRYGHLLEGTDAEKAAYILLCVFDIAACFVDLGFSLAAGDKLHENSDIGFDDVLDYVHLKAKAHETVAPPIPPYGEEQL